MLGIKFLIIYILNMKNRHRKNRKQPSLHKNHYSKSTSSLISVKFEISKTNISCFIDPNRILKSKSRPKSKNPKSLRKPPTPSHKPIPIQLPTKTIQKQDRQKEFSPDILQESSNSILSKIQERGITYPWKQTSEGSEGKSDGDSPLQTFSIWGDFSQFNDSLDKSFASTNDNFFYQNNYKWEANQPFTEKPYETPVPLVHVTSSFMINPRNFQKDWRTTVMIRNIPNKYSINELAEQIDSQHSGIYDFLYLPCDIRNQCNVGYGFINFISTKFMQSFYEKFQNYVWLKYRSQKICALTYARLQGLNQLIEHFQNSKVLNQKDKRYRPIIKYDHIHKMVREQQQSRREHSP